MSVVFTMYVNHITHKLSHTSKLCKDDFFRDTLPLAHTSFLFVILDITLSFGLSIYELHKYLRYETKPGECSVYSCLNQFTQSELLTGSNKWACENCTTNR